MLLAVAAACSSETIEVPGETVVVEKEVVRTVEVPGETVTVEVVKEVQVPGETVVVEKVVTETVEVPGETVVVKEEVVKTVEVPGETVTVEVVKEVQVPGETVVVEKEVVKTVEVPGQTVVVEKEVVKTVEVPGQTVVVEKEVIKTVEVPGPERVMVKEVRQGYVTDPTNGKVYSAPAYGGTMTFAVQREQPGTDPMHFGSTGADGVAEKLGMVDWGIDRDVYDLTGAFAYIPQSVLTGRLAESWESSPDGLTYTFNIRKGVNWHDKAPMNGRELTAQDIEYNYHRVWGLGSGFTAPPETYTAGALVGIPVESVTATDKYTVAIKLKQPRLVALAPILIDWGAFIMPPEVIKQHGDVKDWRNLVGTGPFMLTDWVEGSSMTWEKNPDYWGYDEKFPENRLPYFDGLSALIMKEPATILAALRSGQVDYVGVIGIAEMIYTPEKESIERTNPEIAFYPWSIRSENSFPFNMATDNPFSKDVRVRRAMQMALDLETMNNTYFRGVAKWKPRGVLGDAIVGYNTPFEEWPEEVRKGYMYDPEGAEKLLDEAGYPRGADGIRIKATAHVFEHADFDYAQLAASYWKAIGVDVEIIASEAATHGARVREHTYGDMVMWISGMNWLDPVVALGLAYSKGGYNPSGYNDPEYDRLYEAARDATTIEERQRAVKAADMYFTKNHIYIWGPDAPKFNAVQPWVRGYAGEQSLGSQDRKGILSRL